MLRFLLFVLVLSPAWGEALAGRPKEAQTEHRLQVQVQGRVRGSYLDLAETTVHVLVEQHIAWRTQIRDANPEQHREERHFQHVSSHSLLSAEDFGLSDQGLHLAQSSLPILDLLALELGVPPGTTTVLSRPLLAQVHREHLQDVPVLGPWIASYIERSVTTDPQVLYLRNAMQDLQELAGQRVTLLVEGDRVRSARYTHDGRDLRPRERLFASRALASVDRSLIQRLLPMQGRELAPGEQREIPLQPLQSLLLATLFAEQAGVLKGSLQTTGLSDGPAQQLRLQASGEGTLELLQHAIHLHLEKVHMSIDRQHQLLEELHVEGQSSNAREGALLPRIAGMEWTSPPRFALVYQAGIVDE